LLTALFSGLSKWWAGQNVYFCVFAENREILDIINILPSENVFVIRNRQFSIFSSWTFGEVSTGSGRLVLTPTVDMEFFARASAILSYLTGATRRVGLHRFTSEAPYRGDLMTHRVHYNPYLHTAKAYHLLVEALKVSPVDIPLLKIPVDELTETAPQFIPGDDEIKRVQMILAENFPSRPLRTGHPPDPNAVTCSLYENGPRRIIIRLGQNILNNHPEAVIIITGAAV